MSHFSVAVITDDPSKIDEYMAPYQENNMGDCPREYMEFVNVEEENLQEYENEGTDMIISPEGEKFFPWDNRFRKDGAIGHGSDTHQIPNRFERVEVPYKEIYPTFDEFMTDFHGYSGRNSEFGVYGYWQNPEARWDWFEIGGRWSGMLLVKEAVTDVIVGGHYGKRVEYDPTTPKFHKFVDGARLKDIEFETMANLGVEQAKKRWEQAEFALHELHQKGETTAEISDGRFYFEYGIRKGQTKESYIKRSEFGTFAVLNGMSGEWCEKGKMGWWAASSETEEEAEQWELSYFENFIKNQDQEFYLVIVDCHI